MCGLSELVAGCGSNEARRSWADPGVDFDVLLNDAIQRRDAPAGRDTGRGAKAVAVKVLLTGASGSTRRG